MAKIENSMECIDALIDKMFSRGLSAISVKAGDFEIKLERASEKAAFPQMIMPQYPPMPPYIPQQPQVQAAAVTDAPAVTAPNGNVVKAPVVGIYYSASSPNDKPFVKVGKEVKKGDVIFIIESMKVMNEIKSEFDGTVTIINVKDGEAVEYDQPVMIIS
ncbi:MAG: acetyl-CoA carboxylase biotin carboxyl carrier protein [Oscillospiraceae bacterium]